ncbi:hypothetical protein JCM21714_1438 [Gracilibacillus boraciitolerans JCM 21714]|uniref:HTH cro/C1-type domain-containing protein n=1 Tax=Gracilibacillus boraciitolerans JCM 21714 TaxID=1298598 RepID=W4VH17_9BACI|nr:helix-turn-helix transcriptional regulator [Gracilibacillus boraciitolerans]GAE92436.1 hypothetical protein JCM21714_1438 [Gracilibacillus boraciitolerans JCM 21714]
MANQPSIHGIILGYCIRHYREALQKDNPKWTQHFVGGESAGLDPEHYSKIERGKYPHTSFITVANIARTLDCSLDTLFEHYEKELANYYKNRLDDNDGD